MRRVGYSLGCLLVMAALAVAAWELMAPDATAGIALRPAGELWFRLHAGSLNLVQAVIERYVWPPLWDPAIVGVLRLPALFVFAVPGFLLLGLSALASRRRRKRWRFK